MENSTQKYGNPIQMDQKEFKRLWNLIYLSVRTRLALQEDGADRGGDVLLSMQAEDMDQTLPERLMFVIERMGKRPDQPEISSVCQGLYVYAVERNIQVIINSKKL